MKQFKKSIRVIISMILVMALLGGSCVFATDSRKAIFTLENTCEIIEIENTEYKYEYFMEDGMRVVTITNMSTNSIDKITYNPITGAAYLNNSLFAERIKSSANTKSLGYTADGWEILARDSYYITWSQGTTIAIVAGAIAVYLGSLGAGGVIAAMGAAALSVLAACCAGGTLDLELHMYSMPFVETQYRYKWSFTANTGESYGPYYTQV